MTGLVPCPECQGNGRIHHGNPHGNPRLDPENAIDTECNECAGTGAVTPSQAAAIRRRIDREWKKWDAL